MITSLLFSLAVLSQTADASDWEKARDTATRQQIVGLTAELKLLATSKKKIPNRQAVASSKRKELKMLREGRIKATPQLTNNLQPGMMGRPPDHMARVKKVIDGDTAILAFESLGAGSYVMGVSKDDPHPRPKSFETVDEKLFVMDNWPTAGACRYELMRLPRYVRVESAGMNGVSVRLTPLGVAD
jgi:hypothetical protein